MAGTKPIIVKDISFKLKKKFDQKDRTVFVRSVGNIPMAAIVKNPLIYIVKYKLVYLFELKVAEIKALSEVKPDELRSIIKTN